MTGEKTTATLPLKKNNLKSATQFTIKLQTKWLENKIYTKDLELESDSSVFVQESKSKPGLFDISKAGTKMKLQSGKTVQLYLILTPSNPKMSMPSRRIYLGTLVSK